MSTGAIRVVIVDHGASFGGAAVVAARLIRALDPAQVAATLVCAMDAATLGPVGEGLPIVPLAPDASYEASYRWRAIAARWPWPIRQAATLGSAVIRIGRNLPYSARLSAILRSNHADILHLNNGSANIGATLAGVWSGVPLVAHVHGPEAASRVARWTARRVAHFVSISQFVTESLRRLDIPAAKISTIPNPVLLPAEPRLGAAQARLDLGIPSDAPVVGMVGRIVRWKGQLEFLAAAARVLREIPAARAVLVGDVTDGNDDYGERVRRAAAESGVGDRIHFAGFRAEMAPVYALMDVLVHSSIEPEPFGLVITEAMSHGIPVVAAPSGAPPEIITEGFDGFLRNPEDPAGVAACVVDLLRDPSRRREVGGRARTTVASRYDPARYAERLTEVYRTVAGRA